MRKIPITKGKFAIVDDDDYEKLSAYKWHVCNGYAARSVQNPVRHMVYMHRALTQCDEDHEVDHISGNRLDNRKSNLRICTRSGNMMNVGARSNGASGLKGASLHKASGLWRAQIARGGKCTCLGYFRTKELAHEFYCLAADLLHGEFARHA